MNSTSSKNDLPKFGIALSGGGARGIAHIGVLAALENFGIKPQVVSGTSIGAIVGVLYAAGYSPKEMLKILVKRKFHKIINWHRPFSGLLDMGRMQKVMGEMIGEDDFSSLKIPFYCAVTNLNSGQGEIKSEGKLFQWVMASASIPVVFEPRIIDGQTYVDWRSCKPQRARGRGKRIKRHCRTCFQTGHCPKCGRQQTHLRFCD